jgi:cell fate (sporulation/competence/biofilm development) regulator YlbF (YheA/YmcA/DUF963 family)
MFLNVIILALLIYILVRLEIYMSSSSQGLTDLQAAVAAQTAQAQAIVAAFQALEAQIAALQAAGAGEVTDAQLETLAQTLQQAQATVAATLAPAPPTS